MPMKRSGRLALGPPDDEQHYEHHETLVDVIPALNHHTVKPHAATLGRCHEIFVVKSAYGAEHRCENDKVNPLVVFEVYAFFFPATAEHKK